LAVLAAAVLQQHGFAIFPGIVIIVACSPVEFGKLMAEETEKWAKVIRFANIKPE
jgi:hypothetical protein